MCLSRLTNDKKMYKKLNTKAILRSRSANIFEIGAITVTVGESIYLANLQVRD